MRDLTLKELEHINATGHCPACKMGELVGGPCGGMSQNHRCQNCGEEFNLTLYPEVIIGECLGKDDNRIEFYTGNLLSEKLNKG